MTDKKTEPTETDPKILRKLAKSANRNPAQQRAALRRLVRYFYDIQRLRLQTQGRLHHVAKPEGEDAEVEREALDDAPVPESDGSKAPLIELHPADIALLESRCSELEKVEKEALKDIQACLDGIPFYAKILSDKSRYKGIGPTMAGLILAEFDIERCDTPSKMWAYAGLAPVPAFRCRSCHGIAVPGNHDSTYYTHVVAKARPGAKAEPKSKCPLAGASIQPVGVYESGQTMRPTKGEKLTYNAMLRSKLVGVLADVMIKLNSPWRKKYDEYKARKVSQGWGKSDAHRHMAAKRYMIKMLLLDIQVQWRTFEGLPVRQSYQDAKLGNHDGGGMKSPALAPEISPEVLEELKNAEV